MPGKHYGRKGSHKGGPKKPAKGSGKGMYPAKPKRKKKK